jgi:hypothetical protein
MEQKIKDLEKQVKDLQKKLEDRNPAFNGNLLRKSDEQFTQLQMKIGTAIQQAVGQDLVHVFKDKRMVLDFDSSTYGGKGWSVYFIEDADNKSIKDSLANLQMKKFQESLDNFAWAVNNGSGQ